MKLDRRNTEHLKALVCDPAGQPLPYVVSFDTETCEVEMLLKIKDEKALKEEDERQVFVALNSELKPFVAKFVFPGAFALDAEGKRL